MKKYIGILIVLIALVGCSSLGNTTPKETNEGMKVQVEEDVKQEIDAEHGQGEVKQTEQEQNDEAIQEDKIESYMQQMTIEEKIGQLFMIAVRKDSSGTPITSMNEEVRTLLNTYPIGGIILFKENIVTADQTQRFIVDLQSCSKIPMFIGVDEEGGSVSRVGNNP